MSKTYVYLVHDPDGPGELLFVVSDGGQKEAERKARTTHKDIDLAPIGILNREELLNIAVNVLCE